MIKKNTVEESSRVGVIDVGSNSVRLVVFDGAIRSPSYFYNEKVMAGLGLDLAKTGKLHPEGKERALKALRRFHEIAGRMDLQSLAAVATEAVRAASDGPEFCQRVLDEIGIELVPISGDQEANLSAQGVLLGWPKASGLVCDIGGASMELASLEVGDVKKTRSSKLGPMAILGRFDDVDAQEIYLKTGLEKLTRGFDLHADTLFLVGGSWRALAHIHMSRTDYPLRVLHDYVVSPIAFLDTLDFVENRSAEELQEQTPLNSSRARLLPMAAKTLRGLLGLVDVGEIAFSSYGLREGLMYENMPVKIRNSDPLIAAARAVEAGQARFPGFGDVLFNWLSPLFTTLDGSVKRLIHAACLLHDVHWRSHPDYRAEVCFDAATLANLGGIDHGGRVFLAWTLLHRYKGKRVSQNYSNVRDLLQEDELNLARTVGLAIRLGAMMSSADPEHMGRLILTPKALNLELDAQSEEVFGEVVMKRLQSVAQSIDRTATVSYV
jgi:exopolyphosphatase/guanosine-5'-triphosphate,3'-diphosphate pyrophosphatase